jgi:SAM-dependent methyltransferase
MRHAYAEQENRYRQLATCEKGVDYAGESFDFFDLRPFLEQVLPALSFAASPPRALEYGTGTGPGACFLAHRGFQVDGIDIAPTALALARKYAAERDLKIHYEVQDICCLHSPPKVYDLVVDNFCLQRIVTDDRRRQALAVVRSVLKPHGYYVIGTTIYREGRELRPDEEADEQSGIVYRKLGRQSELYEDAVERNGQLVYPRVRRVRPEALRAELEEAGFRILRQKGGRVLCQDCNFTPSC